MPPLRPPLGRLGGGRPIIDLAAGDIDDQLGELGGIAGTLEALVWHGASMRGMASDFQPCEGLALFKGAHYRLANCLPRPIRV